MSTDELKALLDERIVFDLGQLSEEARRWLGKQVKAGNVQKLWNTQRHREGRYMYWIAA